jgi:hypothetical protein
VSDDSHESSLAIFSGDIEIEMHPWAAAATALIFFASCSKAQSRDPGPKASEAPSPPASGSGKGFSADLAKDMAGSGNVAAPAGQPPASPSPKATADVAAAGAKPGDEAKVAGSAIADAKPSPVPRATEPAPAGARTGQPSGTGVASGVVASGPAREPESRGPAKVPGDLAAIKLSLLPNWDRDIAEAGTFQYVVRIKGTQSTKTFLFRYGYDDPRAPTDREEYKKYLQQTSAMTGEIKDRQRGSAWLLEGNDASGLPAFRYVVLYGGKRLICYGSMYRDAASNPLGDDRDQTVIQAKQICESLSL